MIQSAASKKVESEFYLDQRIITCPFTVLRFIQIISLEYRFTYRHETMYEQSNKQTYRVVYMKKKITAKKDNSFQALSRY